MPDMSPGVRRSRLQDHRYDQPSPVCRADPPGYIYDGLFAALLQDQPSPVCSTELPSYLAQDDPYSSPSPVCGTDVPPYLQDGLQTKAQLKAMLEAQLEALWPLEEPILRSYLPRLDLLTDGRRGVAMDVGCAMGGFTRKLAGVLSTQFDTIGVDIDPLNVEQAMKDGHTPELWFEQGNAYNLDSVASGSVDLVTCRSLLYTLPQPQRVVAELVRVLRPGGIVHFLCEDYGAVVAHPCELDVQGFWRLGPCQMFEAQGANPFMGRSIYTEAVKACKAAGVWGRCTVGVTPVCVDTCSTPRGLLAKIFTRWKDYSQLIADHSEVSREDAEAHWEDIIACCRKDEGYVAWHCTQCTIQLD